MTNTIVGSRIQNLTSQRFGRLLVLSYVGKNYPRTAWLCACDCGESKVVFANNLRSGKTKSCGCLRAEKTTKRSTTHGKRRSLTYESWLGIKSRCYCSGHVSFEWYGRKGIQVCKQWKNSFENFLKDMGERPSSRHSIDRIDSDGDYCPENCRWATEKEQSRNRSSNRMISYKGKTQCLTAWAEEAGLPMQTLHKRITRYKWSIEKALTTPVRK
jgi:hypothetical protein